MNLVLFDDPDIRVDLLPFTYTRPVSEIRIGILTVTEKWAHWFKTAVSFKTEPYLQAKFPFNPSDDNLFINGALCPDKDIVNAIKELKPGDSLKQGNTILASRQKEAELNITHSREYEKSLTLVNKVWVIFQKNGEQIRADFNLITIGRKSAPLQDKPTIVYQESNIFLEEGVTIKAAILNAENGPIYLGKGSVIQEGAMIRGPFALGEGAHINMGAKIRGDVSIGPYSKVGGEVSASVIFGYSNKSHDGFMGCSVIGEWCNFGADSNTSNLKNNYANVKIWSHKDQELVDTGLQFCGLMMGDHSKCGINTMFNTGTIVDVSCNIFGGSFPSNYIPSYSWGGSDGFTTFRLDKALEVAQRTMARRDLELTPVDIEIMNHVFEITKNKRDS